MKLLIITIIIIVSVSVLLATTAYSETVNYSISGNYHDYKLELIFSEWIVTGTITNNEKIINLDNLKLIERNNGFLIIDKEHDLKILSKKINNEKQLVLVKIKPDIKLRFIVTMDSINKNIGQRDMFAAMGETKQNESNLSFKELEYQKKNDIVNEVQQQYEKNLNDLVKCNYDGSGECLSSDEILANFEQYKIVTGMALVVPEKIIKEKIITIDNRVLHVLTSHYDKVSNNQGDVFRFEVKTFDKNVYSGVEWDKFEGKMEDAVVTAKIKDSDGIMKKEFSGLTKYGIFQGEVKIDGEIIYPVGNYSLELVVDFNGQKFNDVLYFIIYSDSTAFNNRAITNAGADQHLASGSIVTLDGSSSSDIDDNILFYIWSQTNGTIVTLSSNTAEKPTFTIPDVFDSFIFSLLVDDGRKDSNASDSVTITSLHSDAGPEQEIIGLGLVTLDGSVSGDALSHSFTYSWIVTAVPGGSAIPLDSSSLSDPAIVNPTFTTDVLGEYTIQLTVNDSTITDIDTILITVS